VLYKYQTGLLSTICNLLIDTISDWLNSNHVCRRFVMTSVFLSVAGVYSQWLCGIFWCGHCKFLFHSEQNDANVTGWIFFSNWFKWLFASLSSTAWQFLSINISQGTVVKHLRSGGYWVNALPEIYC